MSLPQTKRKVMGRIDLAAEDSQQRNNSPHHIQRPLRAGIASGSTSSATPVRNGRPLSATPLAKTPGSARARVDLSSFATPDGQVNGSPFASISAPVTPRIGAGPSGALHTGPGAGVSLRSPSPSRPSPRPVLSPAASSGNITPRSAARVRARQPSITSHSADSAPSISIPHSHTLSSLPPSGPITSPRSGRSSPVRPAYLGHVRANTHAVIPNAASLRSGPSTQRLSAAVPPHYRPGSPVRASSPDSHSTISTSSQSDASWHPTRRSVASEGLSRPALTPIQVYDPQPHLRRRSSGYSAPAVGEPSKAVQGGGNNVTPRLQSTAQHSPPRSTLGLPPPLSSPQKLLARVGGTAPPSGLVSPVSEVSPSEPLEYAQLRVERKIADLEITNKSLLAINSGLEVTKHRQAREIRDLKRRLRERGRTSTTGASPSSAEEYHDAEVYSDDEDEDSESSDIESGSPTDTRHTITGPREDPELAAAHIRCKTLIDDMLNKARAAITWQYVHDASKSKVLSLGEVTERQQEEEEEEAGDTTMASEMSASVAESIGTTTETAGEGVESEVGEDDTDGEDTDSDDDSKTVDARQVFPDDVDTLDPLDASDPDVSID